MNNFFPSRNAVVILAVVLSAGATACSTMHRDIEARSDSDSQLSTTRPTIIDARINPGTIEVNRDYQPTQVSEILAEVKDFSSNIKSVRLVFKRAPIEVELKHLAGTTWRGELSQAQIRKLAIGNQTTHYEASIEARSDDGRFAIGDKMIDINIKAPDLSLVTSN